jgi:hypothetical protein
MQRRSLLLSVVCMLPIVLLLLTACHKETDEDKIRDVISRVQKAAEEKKVLSVLEHVSKTYRDPQGNDYDGIKGLLAFSFFRHQKVGILVPSIDVTVTGPGAQATFQAILTGRGNEGEKSGSLLPDTLGAYDFDVQFTKEKDEWKVTSARWERAGSSGQ